MTTITQKHPALSFFALTYLFSWLCWLPLFLSPEAAANPTILIALGGFGPFIAALILVLVNRGRRDAFEWLKRIFRLKLPAQEYLLALLLPILVGAIGFGIYGIVTGSRVALPEGASLLQYPLIVLVVTLIGGGQEEPGWRGYALPVLLEKRSMLAASVIIGVVWSFWHLPLFFLPEAIQSSIPFGWYILNTIAISTLLTVVYVRMASVLPAMLLHAGMNALGNYAPASLTTVYPYAAVATLIVAAVSVALYGWRGFASRERA